MYDQHKNLAQSKLAAVPVDVTNGVDFEVMPGDGQLFAPNMPVTMWPDDEEPSYDNAEVGYLTTVDGDALIILRGQEGSLAKQVAAGWRIAATITERTFLELEEAIDAKVDAVPGFGLSSNDYTDAEQTKLADVAPGATQNATDADLRDRATHTGAQPIASVTGLQTALDDKQPTGDYATNAGVSNATALKQDADATLTALAGLSTATGALYQTGADAFAKRTMTGSTNRIVITNANGVSDAPSLDIGTDVVTLTGIQTLSGKTMTSPILTNPDIGTATGSASLNVLKAGDTMTGLLAVQADVTNAKIRVRNSTGTSFLVLENTNTDADPNGRIAIYRGTTLSASIQATASNALYINSGVQIDLATADTVRLRVEAGGSVRLYGDLIPATTGTRLLGNSTLYWSNLYASRLNLNGTAYLDGATAGRISAVGTLYITNSAGDAININTTGSNTATIRISGDGTERGALYAANGSSVFQVRSQGDLSLGSAGIPGQWVIDTTGNLKPRLATFTVGSATQYAGGLFATKATFNSTANIDGTTAGILAVTGKITTTNDVEITDITKGVVLKSPDGTRYRITVANGGALSTSAA